ncbi:condensation domain-containing protein [Mycobacterium persicum]|uniref:condensation domain-containing protein n=1 Tax=Mycobacterium persicum TaxID=1487726 RepID=UPI0015934B47|nr:condensation domain-containing protein [Mycobacterium persicum]
MSVPGWLIGLRDASSPLGADFAPLVFQAVDIDPDMLVARLPVLVSRHEALRLVWPDLSVGSPEAVLDAVLGVDTHGGDIGSFAAALALAGYRCAGKPLWRVRLFATVQPPQQYVVVGLDRLITDPWSLHVLAQELCLLCHAGPPPDLGPPPAQFGAVLADRAAGSDDSDARAERLHWRRQLADANLGADPRVPRSAVTAARIRRVPLTADDEQAMVALASAYRTTLLAPVVAAVHLVWRRQVGAAETVLLTEVGHRDTQELDGAVAPLMEPRPMRITSDVRAGPLISQARDALLDVLDNSCVPLATDPTPMQPFFDHPDRMTVLAEFDTPNQPTVPDSTLNLLDQPSIWALGPPRADVHVMVRGEHRAPSVYLADNPLAVTDQVAEEFAHGLVSALRAMTSDVDA